MFRLGPFLSYLKLGFMVFLILVMQVTKQYIVHQLNLRCITKCLYDSSKGTCISVLHVPALCTMQVPVIFFHFSLCIKPKIAIPTGKKQTVGEKFTFVQANFILYSRITFNLVKTDGCWRPWFSFETLKLLGVGVWSLLLSEGRHNIHKSPVVLDATLSTASLLLLLLLLVNLDRETSVGKFHTVVLFILKEKS